MIYTRGKSRHSRLAVIATLAASLWASPSLAGGGVSIEQVAALGASGGWQIDQVEASYATRDVSPVSLSQVSPSDHWLGQITPLSVATGGALQIVPTYWTFTASLASVDQLPQMRGAHGGAVELAFLGLGLNLGDHRVSGTGTITAGDENGNVTRRTWSGDNNLQAAVQHGSGNEAVIGQEGVANAALLLQSGEINFASVTQHALAAQALVIQAGRANRVDIVQQGANSFALVSQSGSANIAFIRQ